VEISSVHGTMSGVQGKTSGLLKGSKLTSDAVRRLNSFTRTTAVLPLITQARDGTNQTGVSVDAYGVGQLSAVFFTAPAHSETEVDLTINMFCLTPDDVTNLSNLIRSLLDASKKHVYDELEKTDISGGAGFFGFFCFGVSASYSDTKHRMDSWGLSEENQRTIVKAMMEVASRSNTFHYKSIVHNTAYDYDVTGNMYGIVMDVTASFEGYQKQNRVLAPVPQLRDQSSGASLPAVDPLYPPPPHG
jgi:hypothetical protein